jgi:sugar/nucleoside kinase (ribokinase family)
MTHDVISIGSALVDIFIQSPDFQVHEIEGKSMLCTPYNAKSEVESFTAYVGGGGCNTAVGFTVAGFRAGLVSELGTDTWSNVIMEELKNKNVDTSLLISEKKEQTGGSVILLSPEGGRTVMVHRGASSLLDPQDIPDQAFAQTSWVHLSSISGRLETLQKLFSLFSQHKLRFSWNPGKSEITLLINGELSVSGLQCAVLFVNDEEWAQLTPVQEQLHRIANQIVITNGDKGGKVLSGGSVVHEYQASSTTVVNETGAGDSFAVGYVSGLLMGKDMEGAINCGKANAASVVQSMGATNGLLNRDQLLAT